MDRITDIEFEWDDRLGWISRCLFEDGYVMGIQIQKHYSASKQDLLEELLWNLEALNYELAPDVTVRVWESF